MSEVLYRACLRGDKFMVQIALWQIPGGHIELSDDWDTTPLHEACRRGWLDVVEFLIENLHHSLDVTEWFTQQTPLHLSCILGLFDIVVCLINHGCNPLLKDNNHQEALDYALQYNHPYIVHYLYKHCISSASMLTTDRIEVTLRILRKMVLDDNYSHLDWKTANGDRILEVVFWSKLITTQMPSEYFSKLLSYICDRITPFIHSVIRNRYFFMDTAMIPYFISCQKFCVSLVHSKVILEWLNSILDPKMAKVITPSYGWMTVDNCSLFQIMLQSKVCVSRLSSSELSTGLSSTNVELYISGLDWKTADGVEVIDIIHHLKSKFVRNYFHDINNILNVVITSCWDSPHNWQVLYISQVYISQNVLSKNMFKWLQKTQLDLEKIIIPYWKTADGDTVLQLICNSETCVSHISSKVMLIWLKTHAVYITPNYKTSDGHTLLQLVCQSEICVSRINSLTMIRWLKDTDIELLISGLDWKTSDSVTLINIILCQLVSPPSAQEKTFSNDLTDVVITPHWDHGNLKSISVFYKSEIYVSYVSSNSMFIWLQNTTLDLEQLVIPHWKTADGDTLLQVVCQSESCVSHISSTVMLKWLEDTGYDVMNCVIDPKYKTSNHDTLLKLICKSESCVGHILSKVMLNWLKNTGSDIMKIDLLSTSFKTADNYTLLQLICQSEECVSCISSTVMNIWLRHTSVELLIPRPDWKTADGVTLMNIVHRLESLTLEKKFDKIPACVVITPQWEADNIRSKSIRLSYISESYISHVPSKSVSQWLENTSLDIEDIIVPHWKTADGHTLLQLVCQSEPCVSRTSSTVMLKWLMDKNIYLTQAICLMYKTCDGDTLLQLVYHSEICVSRTSSKVMLNWLAYTTDINVIPNYKTADGHTLLQLVCQSETCVSRIHSSVLKRWLNDTDVELLISGLDWKTSDGVTMINILCHLISQPSVQESVFSNDLIDVVITPHWNPGNLKSITVFYRSEIYVSYVPSNSMFTWLQNTTLDLERIVIPHWKTADGDTLLQLVCQSESCVSRISSTVMLKWLEDAGFDVMNCIVDPKYKTSDHDTLLKVVCQSESCVSSISSKIMLKWLILTSKSCHPTDHIIMPWYKTADDDTLLQIVCKSRVCVSRVSSSLMLKWLTNATQDLTKVIIMPDFKTADGTSLLKIVCYSEYLLSCILSQVILFWLKTSDRSIHLQRKILPSWQTADRVSMFKVICTSQLTLSHVSSSLLLMWFNVGPGVEANFSILKTVNPNWTTSDGDSILHLLCQSSINEIKIIQLLECYLKESNLNPDTRDSKGDAAIHIACKVDKPIVVKYLIKQCKCNPRCENLRHEVPIELTTNIDSIDFLTEHGAVLPPELIIKFIKNESIPNQRLVECINSPDATNSEGKTALHLACQTKEESTDNILLSSVNNLLLVLCLLKDYKCNPNCVDNNGHMPLQLTSDVTIMKELIRYGAKLTSDIVFKIITFAEDVEACKILSLARTILWRPSDLSNSGDTALHLACKLDKLAVAKYLLKQGVSNPNSKNCRNELPIELTMHIDIISLLIEYGATMTPELVVMLISLKVIPDQQLSQLIWTPNAKNMDGNTALHLACQLDQTHTAYLLLSQAHCDPNIKNNNGDVPLQMTANSTIIKNLIRYGAQTSMIYESHRSALGLNEPIKPPVKIFVVGNPSVGKSTLTAALKRKLNLVARIFSSNKVSGVDKNTIGIIPHKIESELFGPVTVYDFAGHREFYSGHAALLKAAIQSTPPVFLIVVNLCGQADTILQHILYWISFLENQCTFVSCKPHLIIVGSHADSLKSIGVNPQDKVNTLLDLLDPSYFIHLCFIGFIPMDCQLHESTYMNDLRPLLVKSCTQLRIQDPITFNAHCFLVYLLETFKDKPAVTLNTICDLIKSSNRKGVLDFLPESIGALYKICIELNERGHILFLQDKVDIENSYVIFEEKYLLSEVSGTIFASEGFKQYKQLGSDTGVVSKSKIAECFPGKDVNILIGILTHLEFCCEISDRVLLRDISENYSSDVNERYYLFSGLISNKAKTSIWKTRSNFDFTFGWILRCTKLEQFFSSRLLQVLLLRIAFSLAFELKHSSKEHTYLSIHRKCFLWKNGIFWGTHFGMDTLVEISDNKSIIVMARFKVSHLSKCLQHRSQVLHTILECVEEFCPRISTAEYFVETYSNSVFKYPLNITSEMSLCTVQDLAEALVLNCNNPSVVVSESSNSVSAQSFISFEPYTELEACIINELWDKENSKEVVPKEFLLRLVEKVSSNLLFLIKVFNKDAHIPCSKSDLYQEILNWRDTSNTQPKTYSQVRELYNQHSVFAGRNPLDIAEVEISSLVPRSIETVSVEVGHINEQLRGLTPKLDELLVLKFANGKELRIMEKVAPFWKEVAISLGFNETRIKSIEMGCHYQSEDACREMFSLWLEGIHSCLKPTTWSSLIQALNFINQMEIAATLSENLTLHEEDESNIQCSLPEPSMPSVSQSSTSSMKGLQSFQSSLKCPPAESLPEDISTFLVQGGEAPELKDLLLLEFSNGKELKIVDRVTHIWKDIAITLGFNRAKIRGIEMSCHFQPDDATLEMFRQWLKGAHSELKPATWSTLVQSLKDVKLTEAANMLTTMQIKDDKTSVQSSSDSSLLQLHTPCGQQSDEDIYNYCDTEFECSLRREILKACTFNRMANECDHQQSEVQSTKIIITKRSLPTLDMKTLELVEGHGGRKIKVIEGVGARWKDLAMKLDIQEEIIDQIEEELPSHCHQKACRAVLARWLEGDGGEVSWSNLTQGLITAGLPELADDLRETLKM